MKKEMHNQLVTIILAFLMVVPAGCSTYSTDKAMVTTYTESGEFIRMIDDYKRIIEVSSDGQKVKLGASLESLNTIQLLVEGDRVNVTYEGPPNIEGIYRLVSIEKED